MVTTHPISPPDGRTGRRRLVLVGLAIILVFAVIGVVSAGIFVGSALSSSAKTPAKASHPTAVPGSLRDVRRAQAQATSIVVQARKTAKVTAQGVTAHARAQATALVAAARRRAGAVAVPTAASVQPVAPTYGGGGTSASATSTFDTGATSGSSTSSSAPAGAPDLSGAPASWKVVAYNATFESGGVGTVTVLNRGSGSFSGTVKIAYRKGGAAYASFSGLGPGQTEILALSGSPYPGGGYTILLPSVH